jgi:hypothetical protein
MGFNIEDYEPVAARFARFIEWRKTSEHFFAVVSEMLSAPGSDVCVFKTTILCDGVPVATGHAEEIRNAGNVNRTSHVENCETSSLGRCLANFPMANFAGSDVNKRPSREEMAKVQRMTANQAPNTSNGPRMATGVDARMPAVTVTQPADAASDKQIGFAKSLLKKAGHPYPANLERMGKRDVTALIDDLKAGTYTPAPPVETDEDPF